MNAMRRTAPLAAIALAGTLALSACSSGGTTTSAAQSPEAAATSATSAAATSATSSASSAGTSAASPGTTADAAKVDANNASKAEIAAALQAHGVPNADKMANEIEEYRPYTAANIAGKLGDELGKYNVDQATLAKILDSLKV